MIDIKRRNFIKNIYNCALIGTSYLIINEITLKKTDLKFINTEYYVMGTNGTIKILVSDVTKGFSIAEEALKRMRNIEKLASKFAPYSDISILNRYYNMLNNISDETIELLEISDKYNKMTNGYFDIGLGNILTLSGIDKNIPINGHYLKKKDFKENIVKIKKNKAKIERANTTLDLGGIAKGYALDEAMKIFKKNNIEHVAIELGGDIRLNGGMSPNTPWTISIDEKVSSNLKENEKKFNMYSGAVAISAGYIKKSQNNEIFKHHIINPKKLKSENKYDFTIIKGESSTVCDMLATATFNMNENEIINIKKKFNDYEIKTKKQNDKN